MPIIDIQVTYPTDFAWAEEIARAEFSEALRRAGVGMQNAIFRQYHLDDAYVSGKTAKSFQVGEVEEAGDRMSIAVLAQGDRANVAGYLETGTAPSSSRPSPEMVDRIEKWALARGIIGRSEKAWMQRSSAYGLARSILASGIEERNIVEHAEDHYGRYITQIMNAAAKRIEAKINARLGAEAEAETTT